MTWIQRIEQALSASAAPTDPASVVEPRWMLELSAPVRQRLLLGLRPAAVLIPLVVDGGAEAMILTERSPALKNHGGQVSFPGGGIEADDGSVAAAALREAHEEIGLDPASVDLLGYLPTQPTITGFAVTPVVGRLHGRPDFRIDPAEVASAFTVPLEFLFDPANLRHTERDLEGVRLATCEWHYNEQRIWGATALMLLALRDIVI